MFLTVSGGSSAAMTHDRRLSARIPFASLKSETTKTKPSTCVPTLKRCKSHFFTTINQDANKKAFIF